jgi:DNA-binding transcriptional LysR family regulator
MAETNRFMWPSFMPCRSGRAEIGAGAVEAPATGLDRKVATIVGGFSAALALARGSDLIATIPDRHTQALRKGLFTFPLPVPAKNFTVSMLWHPRMDSDPAHRWLRGCVRNVCAQER